MCMSFNGYPFNNPNTLAITPEAQKMLEEHNIIKGTEDLAKLNGVNPEFTNSLNNSTQSTQETSQTQIPNVMENPVPDPSLVEKVAQTQTTEPMTGTQIADKNFNQAVINEQNRAMIQQLNAMKNLYDLAPVGEQGDSWRNAAHNQAEVIRRLARDEGIDLGAWGDGGNISTADSNYALMRDQYQQAKAYQEKFNSVQEDLKNKYAMNSQEYFDDRYDYYRRRGVPHAMAILNAGRETTPYARERIGFLQNAIDEYGIDDGVMNQFGVSVLGNLATEDNILGSAYANAYDMPKKLGEYNRAMQTLMATQKGAMERQLERQRADYEKAVMQANAAMERAELQSNTSTRNTDARIQSDRDIAEYKAKVQSDLALFNAGVQEYLKRLEIDAKNGGNNDVTKTGEYKAAIDKFNNARNILSDLLKSNGNATEDDIKKVREDMEIFKMLLINSMSKIWKL